MLWALADPSTRLDSLCCHSARTQEPGCMNSHCDVTTHWGSRLMQAQHASCLLIKAASQYSCGPLCRMRSGC